jgi:hypothetical protein
MEKIPTAEEFYKKYCNERTHIGSLNGNERLEIMIEFAKLHVETALEAAFLDSKLNVTEYDIANSTVEMDNYSDGSITITVNKDSILNAYPLNLIK